MMATGIYTTSELAIKMMEIANSDDPAEHSYEFAELLLDFRCQMDISQARFAALADLNERTIRRLEAILSFRFENFGLSKNTAMKVATAAKRIVTPDVTTSLPLCVFTVSTGYGVEAMFRTLQQAEDFAHTIQDPGDAGVALIQRWICDPKTGQWEHK